ncbi:hypothetical protein KVT40_007833 [Elsinoe batatas]|uniref:Uncharacterized protein n=1 Tax=Elsinoe batatas TaxID=2601811 RepID=A0A8K0PCN2_9PEZI|nr:hypothetical protein KVT40_007833 [Elsinoe batatas]
MMRRKFSFNFRETFGSGKSDRKGSRDGQSYSDEYSPPPSPHPGRRDPLPARTEVDLRLACAGIVNNTIPSDAYVEHENPYEQLGFPPLDYTAVRSKSEAARQRSMSGSKHTRNFSNPAANNDLLEFPVPNGSFRRLRPFTLHLTGRQEPSKGRVDHQPRQGSDPKSPDWQTGLKVLFSGVQLAHESAARPTQAELPVNHATASASGTFTGKRAKYASYHAPARVDPEIAALKEEDRGRQRKSWYKPFAGGAEEGQGHERGQSRSRSRARSITRGIQEYIRPGSTRGSSRGGSRARWSDSRRSSASSGVMPGGKNVFSWKNWRQSWNSWRESGDFEQDDTRLSNGRSGASLRNRNTLNLNRELPPLPSIDQWQGEDSPSLTQQALERPGDQTAEKPKHIAALWNKSAAKRRSMDLKKSAAELKKEFRKSMGPPSKQKQPDVQRKADYRKSYSDFDYTHPRIPVHQFESPILPHVMATMAPPPIPIITKAQRKPLPLSKSTPTDSLMDGQEVPVSPPPALDPEEIGVAKSTPELTLVIPPPPVTAPPPVPVIAVPSDPPSAESPPSEPVTSATTTSTTDLKTKRKSGNYSWLPVEQEYMDVTPISRSQSVSLKRRSGNYSWLPAESGMPPNADHRASLALKRRSGNYSWVPSESRDSSPAGGRTSMSQKRRSGNYAWTPTEGGETSVSEKRRYRGDMISPIVVPSAVPKRFLEKRQDPITGETEFISRKSSLSSQGSAEFFNSLKTPKYQYADDISSLGTPSPAPSEKEGKKFKWKLGKKRSTTWMDEMEKLGIKDGVLLQDQLNGPPIVRY